MIRNIIECLLLNAKDFETVHQAGAVQTEQNISEFQNCSLQTSALRLGMESGLEESQIYKSLSHIIEICVSKENREFFVKSELLLLSAAARGVEPDQTRFSSTPATRSVYTLLKKLATKLCTRNLYALEECDSASILNVFNYFHIETEDLFTRLPNIINYAELLMRKALKKNSTEEKHLKLYRNKGTEKQLLGKFSELPETSELSTVSDNLELTVLLQQEEDSLLNKMLRLVLEAGLEVHEFDSVVSKKKSFKKKELVHVLDSLKQRMQLFMQIYAKKEREVGEQWKLLEFTEEAVQRDKDLIKANHMHSLLTVHLKTAMVLISSTLEILYKKTRVKVFKKRRNVKEEVKEEVKEKIKEEVKEEIKEEVKEEVRCKNCGRIISKQSDVSELSNKNNSNELSNKRTESNNTVSINTDELDMLFEMVDKHVMHILIDYLKSTYVLSKFVNHN